MAKIKINKLPEGFELKDNTVVQKNTMKNGGMVTGDQADYGLVTVPQDYYTGVAFNEEGQADVRYSLSGVPRDEANIEAEGGETVLTDLNNDGEFGLYDIKGPRHSKGGVPMFLPEGSFVFSDTDKMKFDKKEMAEFGISSKKKKTPAKISKNYPLNKLYDAINDEHSDDITKRSVDLMKNKYNMGLSKLAFKQEEKKKFQDGVPLASHPYIVSLGENPIEFTANVEKITQQQAQMDAMAALSPERQAQVMMLQQLMSQVDNDDEAVVMEEGMARYGTEIPMAQEGSEVIDQTTGELSTTSTEEVEGGEQLSEEDAFQYGSMLFPEDIEGSEVVGTEEETADIPANPLPVTHPKRQEFQNKLNTGRYDVVKTKNAQGQTIIKLTERQVSDKELKGVDKYNKLERLFTSNDPQWMKTVDLAYNAVVQEAQKQGIKNIPSKEEIVRNFLDYQKNNYIISDAASKDERMAKELDKDVKNKNSQDLFNKYSGYNINDEDTKLNQIFFQTLAIADKDYEIPYLSYRAEGPNQKTNWLIDNSISKADGFYGNNTLNQFLDVAKPDSETVILDADPAIKEKVDYKIPNVNKAPNPQTDWWIQDVNNLQALNLTDDNLYLPWRPDMAPVKIDYVLDDFRNGVNASLGAQNTVANALGTAGGSAAIANSNIQGNTLKDIARTINTVNQNNVRTMNSVAGRQAAMDMQVDLINQRNTIGVYDDTNKALQSADNFKNWKIAKNAELQNAAITNRAYAANINPLFDQFNINPLTGGIVDFTSPKAFQPAPVVDQNKRQQQFFDAYSKFQRSTGQTKEPTFQDYLKFTGQGNSAASNFSTMGQQELAQALASGLLGRRAKNGLETKKMAVPFYSGKMGVEL